MHFVTELAQTRVVHSLPEGVCRVLYKFESLPQAGMKFHRHTQMLAVPHFQASVCSHSSGPVAPFWLSVQSPGIEPFISTHYSFAAPRENKLTETC